MRQVLWIVICLILIFDKAAISFSSNTSITSKQKNEYFVFPPYPLWTFVDRGLWSLTENEEVKQSLLQTVKDKRHIKYSELNITEKSNDNQTFNVLHSDVHSSSNQFECRMYTNTLYSLKKEWWMIQLLILVHNLAVQVYGMVCKYLNSEP